MLVVESKMRTTLKIKIDREAKRLKRRRLLTKSLLVLGFILPAIAFFPFQPADVKYVTGTTVKLTASQGSQGNIPIMIVRLNDHSTVRASAPRAFTFRPNQTVKMALEISGTGAQRYRVLSYQTDRQ